MRPGTERLQECCCRRHSRREGQTGRPAFEIAKSPFKSQLRRVLLARVEKLVNRFARWSVLEGRREIQRRSQSSGGRIEFGSRMHGDGFEPQFQRSLCGITRCMRVTPDSVRNWHLVTLAHVFSSLQLETGCEDGSPDYKRTSEGASVATTMPPLFNVSRIRIATCNPERKVNTATTLMAIPMPSKSAIMPDSNAPTAYPRSRQNR